MFDISEDVTIRKKNQITIPKPILKHLNVDKGNKIRFEIDEHGNVVLYKTITKKLIKRKDDGGCSNNISPMGNNGDGDEENKAIVYNKKTKRGKHENIKNDRNTKSGGSSTTTPPA